MSGKPEKLKWLSTVATAIGSGLVGYAAYRGAGNSPGAAALAASIAGSATSIVQNIMAACWQQSFEQAPPGAEELFHNGHLTRLISHGLASCIEEATGKARYSDKGKFRDLQEAIGRYWENNYPLHTEDTFTELDNRNLAGFLHRQVQSTGGQPIGEPEDWRAFIDNLVCAEGIYIEPDLRDAAATHIHRRLGHAIYEHAKLAAENEPAVFAALTLRFQSQILTEVGKLSDPERSPLLQPIRDLAMAQAETLQALRTAGGISDKIPEFNRLVGEFTASVKQLQQRDSQYIQIYQAILLTFSGKLDEIGNGIREVKQQLKNRSQDEQTLRRLIKLLESRENELSKILSNSRRSVQLGVAGIAFAAVIGGGLYWKLQKGEETTETKIQPVVDSQNRILSNQRKEQEAGQQIIETLNRIEGKIDKRISNLKPGEKLDLTSQYDKAIGEAAGEQGQTPEQFLEGAKQLVGELKSNPKPSLDKARLFLATGDYAEAEKEAKDVISQSGQGGRESREVLCRSQFAQLKWNDGLENLKAVASLTDSSKSEEWLNVHWWLGTTLDFADKPSEALPVWEQVIIHLQKQPKPDYGKIADAVGWAASAADDMGDWEKALKFRRHVVEMNKFNRGPEDRETFVGLNNLASSIQQTGSLQEAHDLFSDTIPKAIKALGEDSEVTLSLRNNLADLLLGVGDLVEAVPIAEDVLKRRFRDPSRAFANTLTSVQLVASLYLELDRHDDAIAMLTLTIGAAQKMYGDRHQQTLSARNMLARVYEEMGDYDEAEKIQRELRELRIEHSGADNPGTLTTLNNLALVSNIQGNQDEAENIYLEVIEKRKKLYGEKHPETLHAQNNLAVVLDDRGRDKEAEELYRHVLAVRQEIYERPDSPITHDHPNTILSLGNLGGFLGKVGKYEEAEKLLKDAVARSDGKLGSMHRQTLILVGKLGLLYRQMTKYSKSLEYYQSLLQRQLVLFNDKHHSVLGTRIQIGHTHYWNDDLEAALAEYTKVYDNADPTWKPTRWPYHDSVRWRAFVLSDMHRDDEALPLFEKALAIWAEYYPRHTFQLGELLRNHGIALRKSGKLADSEHQLREALKVTLQLEGDVRDDKAMALQQLGFTLALVGKYDEAQSLAMQAIAMYEKLGSAETSRPATSYLTLAYWHKSQGRSSEARAAAARCIELAKKFRKPNLRFISRAQQFLDELK